MKIINVPRFIMGVINITLALILTLLIIFKTHTMYRFVIVALCLITGIEAVIDSIETERQRQQKLFELQEKARLYGWDKEN